MNHEHLGDAHYGPADTVESRNLWQQVDFNGIKSVVSPQSAESELSPEGLPEQDGFDIIPRYEASFHIHDNLPENATLYKLNRGGSMEINIPKNEAYGDYIDQYSDGEQPFRILNCRRIASIYLVDKERFNKDGDQKKLQLFDARASSAFDCDFFLLGDESDATSRDKGCLRLDSHKDDSPQPRKYYLGRGPYITNDEYTRGARVSTDFNYALPVSRTHLSIQYLPPKTGNGSFASGKIIITDEESTNGTFVACNPSLLEQKNNDEDKDNELKFFRADYTPRAVAINEFNLRYDETNDKYYTADSKEVIDRNTNGVNGKVQLSSVRESIFVDSDSPAIREVYAQLKEQINEQERLGYKLDESRLLALAYVLTQDTLKYDGERTENICIPYYYQWNERLNLSKMVEAGVGVCRHQALLVASLIESLHNDGFLQGQVGVERNMNTMPGNEFGGHQWASYRLDDDHDNDIIIDPAQSYLGLRQHGHLEYAWDYSVPR